MLVLALPLRDDRLKLMYFSICGQNNCPGVCLRGRRKNCIPNCVSAAEIKRGEQLVERCVDSSKLSGWRDTHVSRLIISFHLSISSSRPPILQHFSSVSSLYLSVGLLISRHICSCLLLFTSSSPLFLSSFLSHMFVSIASPSLFSLSLAGLGSVASNAFRSGWLSQHMYPLLNYHSHTYTLMHERPHRPNQSFS